MWPVVLTIAGTVLALAGITCGAVAFYSTWDKHGDGPFFPRLARWLRGLRTRFRSLIGKRGPRIVQLGGTAAVAFGAAANATVVAESRFPADASVTEQIAHLLQRIENLERATVDDRDRYAKEHKAIHLEIKSVSDQLEHTDTQLKVWAKSITLDTLKLQFVGILLVAAGTVLLCLASIFA